MYSARCHVFNRLDCCCTSVATIYLMLTLRRKRSAAAADAAVRLVISSSEDERCARVKFRFWNSKKMSPRFSSRSRWTSDLRPPFRLLDWFFVLSACNLLGVLANELTYDPGTLQRAHERGDGDIVFIAAMLAV